MPHSDWDDIQDGLKIYDQYKRGKLDRRRHEAEMEQDLRHREQRLKQELEIERLERFSRMSLEVLVLAADTPEKAKLVASLARTRSLAGLPPEKIALLQLDQDPRIAEALREVVGNLVGSGDTRTQALYERLLDELKSQSDRTREDYKHSLAVFTRMFETFASTTSDVARAASGGAAPPAPPTCRGGPPAPRVCPRGHPAVSPEARFCGECGAPLS